MMIRQIAWLIFLAGLTTSCKTIQGKDKPFDFEAYDYETRDRARVKVLEKQLKKNDMSLEAQTDEIRLEKTLRFPLDK